MASAFYALFWRPPPGPAKSLPVMDRSDCFEVNPNAHGERATHARFPFEAGEVVYTLRGEPSAVRCRRSIEIGPGEHLVDPYAECINHSSSPNLEIRGRVLIALQPIAAGDEVTLDYRPTESAIAAPFQCHHTGEVIDSESCRPGRDAARAGS